MFRSTPHQHASAVFDGCFVLNLDRRTDRWAHVSRQVARARLAKLTAGGAVERVSGVDGRSLNVKALADEGLITPMGYERYCLPQDKKLFGMDLTPGAIGCALGHRKIWQLVKERRLQRALILEDDVEFSPKFGATIEARLALVPSDWELIYFGGLDLLAKGKPPRPFLADGVRYAYQGHRELTAYMLHFRSAARCLELSSPMTWQIDTHITSNLSEDPRASDSFISDPKSYVLQPSLAIQITSIGTDVQINTSENPSLEDASRRMREFVGGGTSVR
jgi:GR25 family glycosyltransferase involved in LPS biosynthesis